MQILKTATLEQLLQAEKVAIKYNARLALAISKEYNMRGDTMIYWIEGKEANLLGLPITSNPYKFNSWGWSEWFGGWLYENKQK